MKGILKKVAGAFVEVEEKPVKAPPIPPSAMAAQQTIQQIYLPNTHVVQEFRERFANILAEENKRNFPGNDYYEFVVMKNAMNTIPQENIRYQAAFAGWATGGNQTKKHLLDTAQVYLGLVEKEISEFEEAYKAEYGQQVIGNEKLIEEKTKEVQSIIERMNTLNQEIQSLKQQNLTNTANLTSKRDSFLAAGNAQKQEIVDEIDKINHYII